MPDFRNQYVVAGGIRTRFWSVGEGGVPLVLLHGLGGTIEDWEGTITPLAQTRRVIAFDLLGSGKTDKPDTCSFAPADMAGHICSLLDALELAVCDLNGWSLGGRLALQTAYRLPRRIRRLVLTAPAGIGPDTILNLHAPLPELLGQIATRPSASGVRLLKNASQSENTSRLLRFAARRVSLIADGPSRRAFLRQLRGFVGPKGYLEGPRETLLAQLPSIAVPTLAIWGKNDNFAPFPHSETLMRCLPDCQLYALADCGHAPHIEVPDQYNAALAQFLT